MLELWWPTFALPWPVVLVPQNYCMESVLHGKMQLHVQNVCSIRNNNNKPAENSSSVNSIILFWYGNAGLKVTAEERDWKLLTCVTFLFGCVCIFTMTNCFEARPCWGWWLCDVFSCTSMMGRPLMRLRTRRLEPQLTKEAFMRSANLEVYFIELGFVPYSFF